MKLNILPLIFRLTRLQEMRNLRRPLLTLIKLVFKISNFRTAQMLNAMLLVQILSRTQLLSF